MVPSTFWTVRGFVNSRVPRFSVEMACLSMKLWVAPLSSMAVVLAILCHMGTEIEIVIESSDLLYMLCQGQPSREPEAA